MFLPTPLAMSLAGAALLAAAGAIWFFLHIIKFALILGAIGGVLLLCAAVALGYEKMGEDKIRPQLIAMTADKDKAVAANVTLQESVARIDGERQLCSKGVADLGAAARLAEQDKQRRQRANEGRIQSLESEVASARVALNAPRAKGESCDAVMARIDSRLSVVSARRLLGYAPADSGERGKDAPADQGSGTDQVRVAP